VHTHSQNDRENESQTIRPGRRLGGGVNLYEHSKTAEQRTINTVIGTLAVDGWAVTLGTARRGLGGAATSSLYQM